MSQSANHATDAGLSCAMRLHKRGLCPLLMDGKLLALTGGKDRLKWFTVDMADPIGAALAEFVVREAHEGAPRA